MARNDNKTIEELEGCLIQKIKLQEAKGRKTRDISDYMPEVEHIIMDSRQTWLPSVNDSTDRECFL